MANNPLRQLTINDFVRLGFSLDKEELDKLYFFYHKEDLENHLFVVYDLKKNLLFIGSNKTLYKPYASLTIAGNQIRLKRLHV